MIGFWLMGAVSGVALFASAIRGVFGATVEKYACRLCDVEESQ